MQVAFSTFVLGLLKPYPSAWQHVNKKNITPLQCTADNKLLDLNVLPIIASYMYAKFHFTSPDVKVKHSVLITKENAQMPGHICELPDGRLAIITGNGGPREIRIHNISGEFIRSIDNEVLSSPYGICIDLNHRILVTDQAKKQVHIFTEDFTHIKSFGDQLNNPLCICVNSAGNIIVSDYYNGIVVFNSEGEFIHKFGSQGDNTLITPVSVSVDTNNNVYVADYHNHRISKYSSDGEFICNFGPYSDDLRHIRHPIDLHVTHDGKYIIIAETKYHRLLVISGADGSFVADYKNYSNMLCASSFIITSDGSIIFSDVCSRSVQKIKCVDQCVE
jgi:DNA-binding beta-propeller fold protein YncE